jgi:hypothetical protein
VILIETRSQKYAIGPNPRLDLPIEKKITEKIVFVLKTKTLFSVCQNTGFDISIDMIFRESIDGKFLFS